MKQNRLFSIILMVFALLPALAFAGQWEGSIQGLMCVTEGQVCPVGMEDALIATESTFVLLTDDGTWYMLPNLDRGILARHINQRVLVEGDKGERYNAITVDVLKVWQKGRWRVAWSLEMQQRLKEKIYRYPKKFK
jgi:hypothetical protein